MVKDYYHLLGLPRRAPLSEVKAAYRKLAAQYHPDKVAGTGPEAEEEANARMLELNEAVAMLSDPVRREQYHRMLDLIPERPPAPLPPIRPVGEDEVTLPPEPSTPLPPLREPKARRSLVREEEGRHLKAQLSQLPLRWRETSPRGWQWGLEATDMRRAVLVAFRHLETLSRLSLRGLQRALEALVEERKHALRSTAIIALVSYGRLMDAQEVQAQLQAAVSARRGWLKNVNPMLVLQDGKRQRTTLLGTPGSDPVVNRVVDYLVQGGQR